MFRDWCPLCGRRFIASTPERVVEMINEHIEDGSCEAKFRPLEEALADDRFDKACKDCPGDPTIRDCRIEGESK